MLVTSDGPWEGYNGVAKHDHNRGVVSGTHKKGEWMKGQR